MPFKKGQSGNAEGRPKGARNQRTKQWDELGEFITAAGAKRAMDILNALDDESYLDQYGKLVNYFRPKLQQSRVEHSGETVNKLEVSEDQIKNLISGIEDNFR